MTEYKHLKLRRLPTKEQWLSGSGFISFLAFMLFVLPMLLPFVRQL